MIGGVVAHPRWPARLLIPVGHGSVWELEARRREAARLLRAGKRQCDVARALGVARQTVNIWAGKLETEGHDALKPGQRGPKSRLTERQLLELVRLLRDGPEAAGYSDGYWTVSRVAAEVELRYQVTYRRTRIIELLREAGFSPQRGPNPRLTERQLSELMRVLKQGPAAAGHADGYWTVSRVAAEIERRYGVTYGRTRIVDWLHEAGFSARRREGQWRLRNDGGY